MHTNSVTLIVAAALGLSIGHGAFADAKNLSCISDESVHARKVLRDCDQIREPEPIYVVEQLPDPNGPPIPIKHGERKGDGGKDHNSHDHGAPGGGNAGGGPN